MDFLKKFIGAQQYGFSCYSQNETTFSDLYFAVNNNLIYDIRNNDVWKFVNYKWIIQTSRSTIKDFGAGKFLINLQTRKLFYTDVNGIKLIISGRNNDSYDTSNRPTKNLFIGMQIYDKNLKKPLWYDGKNWRDSTGTIA
ncbi:hypothetical protein DA469_21825 [Bacillus subtilis]|nr:hypothetical protein DA469_21825 [Bacillus subtilis]